MIWLYIARNRTPNIDCYWVGAVPKIHETHTRFGFQSCRVSLKSVDKLALYLTKMQSTMQRCKNSDASSWEFSKTEATLLLNDIFRDLGLDGDALT